MRNILKVLLLSFIVIIYGCSAENKNSDTDSGITNDSQENNDNNNPQTDAYISIKNIYTDIIGLKVNFSALLENVNSDDVEYLWDFGGGNTSTDANATYSYSKDGVYDVTLTVTRKSDGKTATYTTSVTVTTAIPAEASVDFTCVENNDNQTMTCTAQLIGAEAEQYAWISINNDTGDETKYGRTAVLKLQEGRQKVTVFVKLKVSGKQLSNSKTFTDKILFYKQQPTDKNHMYFALKVKGTSPTKKLFRQNLSTTGTPNYAYARDLHFQSNTAVVNLNGELTPYSDFNGKNVITLCANGSEYCVKGYNAQTGFAAADGSSFNFPFFYGEDIFRVQMNGKRDLTFSFAAFVVRDTTKQGMLMGNPGFVYMIGGNKLEINIPMSTYDPQKHKNVALLNVNFDNYENSGTQKPKVDFVRFLNINE